MPQAIPAAPAPPQAPPAPTPPLRLPAVGMPESIDAEERTLSVTITTTARDRQGDIVEPAGLDFSAYRKNPVVLWAHDLTRPPVARCESIDVGPTGVTATIRFADTPFAREVFGLYAGGYLHAWSLGFVPIRWERIVHDDGTSGFHVHEAEVVEVSAVPVPANPEALTHALKSVRAQALREALEANQSPTTPAVATGIRLSTEQLTTLASSLADTLTRRSVKRLVGDLRGTLA